METLVAVLVNLVYGLLFFAAFVVLVGTVVLFTMAAWDKGIKPLLHRGARDATDSSPK